MKIEFTAKWLKSLKPAPQGQRAYFWDTKVTGFGLLVTDKGAKSFVLQKRWPPNGVPSRRFIGDADILSIAEARGIAEDWTRLIALGKDPREEKRKARMEEQRRQKITFASVAEQWFVEKVRKQKAGEKVEREVRRAFFPAWGSRPITDIAKRDIKAAIKDKAVDTPAMARNWLGYIKLLFKWAAADEEDYGLAVDPAASLSAGDIVGKKVVRKRVLDDVELRAVWRAAGKLGYPYSPLVQMMILTGQRKSEIAEASWPEFDLQKRLWVVPPERMKKQVAHAVPVTDGVLEILDGLPRFKRGEHLFSTSYGKTPVDGFSRAKERLDRLMAEDLGHPPVHFVFHDLRRTMRTGLSALPIPDIVRERVVAHAGGAMHQVYDQWQYLDEKRQALELWEQRLRGIVGIPEPPKPDEQPPADNVVNFAPRSATG